MCGFGCDRRIGIGVMEALGGNLVCAFRREQPMRNWNIRRLWNIIAGAPLDLRHLRIAGETRTKNHGKWNAFSKFRKCRKRSAPFSFINFNSTYGRFVGCHFRFYFCTVNRLKLNSSKGVCVCALGRNENMVTQKCWGSSPWPRWRGSVAMLMALAGTLSYCHCRQFARKCSLPEEC